MTTEHDPNDLVVDLLMDYLNTVDEYLDHILTPEYLDQKLAEIKAAAAGPIEP